MTKGITKKQLQVLQCIHDFIEEKSYGPTVRELCDALDLSSPSTVHVHLHTLEDKGYIERDAMKSRSITLTNKGRAEFDDFVPATSISLSKTIDLPLVGNVAAGQPIFADENITDTLSLPIDIVGDSASFLLAVRGESMIEAGIMDGDYVVVKEQKTANNGDIVVAVIDDSATVKRFYKESDHIRLQPENATMEPIIVSDCLIAGKVVAVFRRL